MNNKIKLLMCVFTAAVMIFTFPSCASRVTEISDPVSAIFQISEDVEYIIDDLIPLADINDEPDPLRVLAREVFDLCNQEREANGLKKFKWDETLYTAAMKRANDLNEDFSHNRPDGSHFYSVLEEVGFSSGVVGENIAIGQKTAKILIKTWMRSESHKAAILGDYEFVAVGVAECPNGSLYKGYAFAQLFYNP